jgi:hypothetical protein
MSIDLKHGTLIHIREVPKLLGPTGRNGAYMSLQQVMRGILKGFSGQKLAAVRCGSRWLTTIEAVQEWVERQAESASGESTPSSDRTKAAHCQASERAGRELSRRGI